MRIERLIYSVLVLVFAATAAVNWRKASLFQNENEQLRARVDELETEATQLNRTFEATKTVTEKARTLGSEVLKLRSEVTELRGSSKTAEKLAADNQRLQDEVQKLRTVAGGAAFSNGSPAFPGGLAGQNQFPRESWTFAGYSSPEAGLVSAIWAMKQGDPKSYLDSLAPDEQQRMSQVWEAKKEGEVAEKHKSDVSSIAGLRVLERQNVSENEVVMNVYLEGPGRVEKIRMNQVGQDWKFGGFIREAQQTAAAVKSN